MVQLKANKKFIVFSVIIFLFVLITGGHFPFLVFYTIIFMYITSFIYLKVIKSQLAAKMVLPDKIYYAGDTITWTFALECYVPMLYVTLDHYENNFIFKSHKGKITLEENMWVHDKKTFYSRGNYDIGKVCIIISDIFTIYTMEIHKDFSKQVTIYPGLYNCVRIETSGRDVFMDKINYNSQKENQYQISDLKKYVPGDAIKKIHWKVSARFNDLYVKHFDNTSGENVIMIVDMNKYNYTFDDRGITEENIIDAVCSLLQYIVYKKVSVTIHLNGITPMVFEINSFSALTDFIHFVIEYKSNGESDFTDFAFNILKNCDSMSKIYIVSAEVQSNLIDILYTAFNRYNIIYYYCSDAKSRIEDNTQHIYHFESILNKNERRFLGEHI